MDVTTVDHANLIAPKHLSGNIGRIDDDLNGNLLEGLQIDCANAARSESIAMTDSNGAAIVYGQPGPGSATETEAAAAYLLKREIG